MNGFTEDPQHDGEQQEARHDGDATSASARPPLRRPASGRLLAGVAAAFSRYFHVDVTIVRVAFAVVTVVGFTGLPYFGFVPVWLAGIPLYLACWLLIPEEGSDHSITARLLESRQHRPG
jgi:phage shock protein PspC (stress-responsive transcriptional regulator)